MPGLGKSAGMRWVISPLLVISAVKANSLHPETWVSGGKGGKEFPRAVKSTQALSWRGRAPAGIGIGSAPAPAGHPHHPHRVAWAPPALPALTPGPPVGIRRCYFPPAGGTQMETTCSAPAGWPRVPWPRRVPAGTPRVHGEMLWLSGPNPAARSSAAVLPRSTAGRCQPAPVSFWPGAVPDS